MTLLQKNIIDYTSGAGGASPPGSPSGNSAG